MITWLAYINNIPDDWRSGRTKETRRYALGPLNGVYCDKAGRTQPEHDRSQDIKTGNRHTNTRVSPRHAHPARRHDRHHTHACHRHSIEQ